MILELKDRLGQIAQASQKINEFFGVEGVLEYICIFCQSEDELAHYNAEAEKLSNVIEESGTGDIRRFKTPLVLPQGTVHFLKVRRPDPQRMELGDCDYKATPSWEAVRQQVAGKDGVRLDEREKFKILELHGPEGSKAYSCFSSPTLSEDYGV